jgi:hypothetical protein
MAAARISASPRRPRRQHPQLTRKSPASRASLLAAAMAVCVGSASAFVGAPVGGVLLRGSAPGHKMINAIVGGNRRVSLNVAPRPLPDGYAGNILRMRVLDAPSHIRFGETDSSDPQTQNFTA